MGEGEGIPVERTRNIYVLYRVLDLPDPPAAAVRHKQVLLGPADDHHQGSGGKGNGCAGLTCISVALIAGGAETAFEKSRQGGVPGLPGLCLVEGGVNLRVAGLKTTR